MRRDAKTGALELGDEFMRLAKRSKELAEVHLIGKQVQAYAAVGAAQKALRDSTEDLIVNQFESGNAVRGNVKILNRLSKSLGLTAEQAKAFSDTTKEIQLGVDGAPERMIAQLKAIAESGQNTTDKFKALISPIAESSIAMLDQQEVLSFYNEALASLGKTIEESSGEFTDAKKKVEQYTSSLQSQLDQLQPTIAAERKYQEALSLSTDEQAKSIDAIREKIGAIKELRKEEGRPKVSGRKKDRLEDQIYKIQIDMGAESKEMAALQKGLLSRMDIINQGRENELIGYELHNEMMLAIGAKYGEDSIALTQRTAMEEVRIAENKAFSKARAESELFDAKMAIAHDSLRLGAVLAKDGSKAQIALFAIDKSLALAQSLMSMQTAIAKANSLGFPANIPAIAQATSVGLGAVNAIKSIAPPSFEGGGFTGMGARSGGMDGKGGFPVMVHPNEYIFDAHQKGVVATDKLSKPHRSAPSTTENHITVAPQFTVIDATDFDELLERRKPVIVNMVFDALHNAGISSI